MPAKAPTDGTGSHGSRSFALASEIVDAYATLKPTVATLCGIPGHDHAWDDLGPGGAAKTIDTLKAYRERARALPASSAPEDRWDRLSVLIMNEFIDMELDWFDHDDHLVDLNNLASSFQMLREVFDHMDTSSKNGWENIAARLDGIDRACEGYRETLDQGRRAGKVVAKRQVRAAIEQGRVHSSDKSFFHSLPGRMKESKAGSPQLDDHLRSGIEKACRSFSALADWLETTYLPEAKDDDAAGRERYLRQTRRFLGMTIDPVETYEWGWQQIREIGEQMEKAAAEVRPGASLQEVIEFLKTDASRQASDTKEFRAFMLERQKRALSELDGKHFDVPDEIREVDVKIAPPGGALTAYYVPPAEDFSRIGSVWYSFGDKKVFPYYDEVSTAYHEGFPGHHLQCGIQVTLAENLSRLHRLLVWFPGYGEGWALYAEHLMNELGYLEKPDYVLGMLAAQMMRACRVAVDIGSHLELEIPKDQPFHPGEPWTFETAVELLTSRAFIGEPVARSEVTRYLGWPGQAISYKVGQRVILELREEMKRRRGAAFDLKEFHARVLNSGPVGLDLLKRLVLEDAA